MTVSIITIVLAVVIVAVILTRRAKLSAILGYLAAGVLLGPWGLGLVTDATQILQVAEFGVVLLLFVIGLELRPRRLWVMRRTVFGLGALQLVLCIGGLAAALRLAGVPLAAAFVGAFGLALASTALVVQVLAERGQLNSTSGRASFSVA